MLWDPSWHTLLKDELEADYFQKLIHQLKQFRKDGLSIYPADDQVFRVFQSNINTIKVVILGQDPYHNFNQANGLSFSVPMYQKIPPSLRNIFKEMESDVEGFVYPLHGDLSSWFEQGVFLLNSILTVEHGKPSSHRKLGWALFTDKVIEKISEYGQSLVFMLWGNYARSKSALIDEKKHLILESKHPSPLAGKGFFGNHHFSKANAFLKAHKKTPIDWSL